MSRFDNKNEWENNDFQRSQEVARLATIGGMDRMDGMPAEKSFSADSAAQVDESDETLQESRRRFMGRVYNWMIGGLALTAALAGIVSHSQAALAFFMPLMVPLIIAEVVTAIAMGLGINKMSAGVMGFCFILYAALTGISFAPIFLINKISTLASTFAITAAMFAALSIYGYLTRRNLSGLRSFCLMGLVGVILGGIVTLFTHSPMLDFVVTCSGILVFAGLTAYDTKKLRVIHKRLYDDGNNDEIIQKMAIMGALTLYLDFINLFLKLLSRRR